MRNGRPKGSARRSGEERWPLRERGRDRATAMMAVKGCLTFCVCLIDRGFPRLGAFLRMTKLARDRLGNSGAISQRNTTGPSKTY